MTKKTFINERLLLIHTAAHLRAQEVHNGRLVLLLVLRGSCKHTARGTGLRREHNEEGAQ